MAKVKHKLDHQELTTIYQIVDGCQFQNYATNIELLMNTIRLDIRLMLRKKIAAEKSENKLELSLSEAIVINQLFNDLEQKLTSDDADTGGISVWVHNLLLKVIAVNDQFIKNSVDEIEQIKQIE